MEERATMKPNMLKRTLVMALVFAAVTASWAEKGKKSASGPDLDNAYLQKIWDGWATLDAAGQKQYYAQGAHVFFDIAPLKYASWDEYQAGVSKVLAAYKSGKCKVNDDVQIHKSGDDRWVTATVAFELAQKSGKIEMGTFRWTAVFEKQDGKWLIVHEHVSEPLP
jgi:ketosteroid isomerase-like protein